MKTKALIAYAGPVLNRNEWRENRSNANVLHSYLIQETNISSKLVYCKDANFPRYFNRVLKGTSKREKPFLIALFGHGDRHSFTTQKGVAIMFSQLAFWLTQAKAPTLVIVNSCESYGLVNYCKALNVDPTLVGVISASSAKELTSGNWLIPSVLERWKNRRNFPKIKTPVDCIEDNYINNRAWPTSYQQFSKFRRLRYQTIRWGARHDHIFFPTGT